MNTTARDGRPRDTSHESIQRAVMKALETARGPAVYDGGAFWAYDGGIWSEVDEFLITRAVQGLNGTHAVDGKRIRVNANLCGSVVSLATAAKAAPGHFDDAPPGVSFADGFVRIEPGSGLEFEPHSEQQRSRHRFDFGYEATRMAACPGWEQALRDWGLDDAQAAFLAEWTGTALLGGAAAAGASVFLFGSGANGKSQCADVVQGLFPDSWRSALSLQDLQTQFRPAELYGKRLNCVPDASPRDVLDSAAFKSAVTGDVITAERKYQGPFTFRPIAGHLFSLNEFPRVSDRTDGFWRRIKVIGFTKRFPPGRRRVPNFGQALLKSEYQGILGWALRGAARRVAQDGFTEIPDELVQEWRYDSDPVALWLAERTKPAGEPGEWTASQRLFSDFGQFAESNGFRRLSIASFGRRLKLLVGADGFARRNGSRYALQLHAGDG